MDDSSDITVFNYSLCYSIPSNDLKMANISPIYKEECCNCRHISFLSVVAGQVSHFADNKILTTYQACFRRAHLTASCLLAMTNYWLINMDTELINGLMFLDLNNDLKGIKDTALALFI